MRIKLYFFYRIVKGTNKGRMRQMTLLLTNTDIKGLLSPHELITELKDGFQK